MGRRKKHRIPRIPRSPFAHLPPGFSILNIMREQVATDPDVATVLRLLKQTEEHFQVPVDKHELAMESIQRLSLITLDQKITIPALTPDADDDTKVLNKLVDMVEYFHKIGGDSDLPFNPERN